MSGSGMPWRVLNPVLAGLALVAVVAAGWAGYSWWSATRGAAETVAARDSALRAAGELAVILQTVDPNHPEDSVRAWQQAATGALARKLATDSPRYLTDLKKSPGSSQATVVDVALTELDPDAGSATAITALDVSQATLVNGVAGTPTVRQLRVKLVLSRTDQGWKVASSGLINA
jgi:Mce-associated membrane protein